LAEEPEITTMENLFLAMPHAPSLKLEKALMKCMTPGVRGSKTPPECNLVKKNIDIFVSTSPLPQSC